VQTVDFFPPVVDDPYAYGQIAAANALSDIYAMGGEPRTALSIAAFPKDGPGDEVIRAIVRGGYDTLTEAGTVLLGGHTVADDEIKFGYAVTGEIDPLRILTNSRARGGDELVLTKPLGTGIIATALKFNRASERQIAAATESMRRLNRDAARVIRQLRPDAVSACTDVTGFGLAGHSSGMAHASGVTLVIEVNAVPLIEGAASLAAANTPGGGRTNAEYFGPRVMFTSQLPEALRLIVFDPQTSGGLLVAIDPAARPSFLAQLADHGVDGRVVGRVEPQRADGILVQLI
jgi:selenide,water dikinase